MINIKRKIFPNVVVIFITLLISVVFAFYLKEDVGGKYELATSLMNDEGYENCIQAVDIFTEIGDYKDSLEYLNRAYAYIEDYEQKKSVYEEAILQYEAEEYLVALNTFAELKDFRDSKEQWLKSQYAYAKILYDTENYLEASKYFMEIDGYNDSNAYVAKAMIKSMEEMKKVLYDEANDSYANMEYIDALSDFEELGDYENSLELAQKCKKEIEKRALANTLYAGIRYTTAVTKEGRVLSTNSIDSIRENIETWDEIVSISALGTIIVGLKQDGKVVTAGKYNGEELDVSEWENIVQIASGQQFIVGLKEDGTVIGAGHNGDGQLDFEDWENIVAIAAGWRHTVGLDKDGNVHIVGYGAKRQLEEIEKSKEDEETWNDWTDIIAIAAGGGDGSDLGNGHTVGLRKDGHVVAVGDNKYGQCNVDEWEGIKAISAGDCHTVGLRENGTVVAVGGSGNSMPKNHKSACKVDDWEGIVSISAGTGYTIGLTSEGEVLAVGIDDENKRSGISLWNDDIMIYEEWNH